ncbi:ABC transporter permease [Gracilibacillus alcaliphilus]|uniref:ABC transporter permease n=1 Tax=Gracilibacillus alcaliphilus TaxID=1401441 RepID=UPI00195BDAD7|nr:ABC transporter permease [Gracilibacillus alcaliphilus]MBM7678122.1 peptide/nickel transport system permease protein [Gracilibacillus alcaliphilus]
MGLNAGYILKRVGFALVTLYVAITVNFLLPRLMGGDIADTIASEMALGSPEVAAALREQFGLDNTNLFYQYKQYLVQLFQGNMGVSYVNYPAPVTEVMLSALPWTLGTVLIATILSYGIGWMIGIKGAWKSGSLFDNISLFVSFFLNSVPYFWIGIIMIMIFSFHLDLFPLGKAIPHDFDSLSFMGKITTIIHHAALPVISMIIASLAGHILVLRNNLIRVLSEDYMLLAKAKGLSNRRRKYTYGARNALLPSFTGLMITLGHVIGGALTMEIVFSYPGVGLVTFNAILNHDFPLIQGAFLFIAISVIIANLIADLMYPIIDPRVALQ